MTVRSRDTPGASTANELCSTGKRQRKDDYASPASIYIISWRIWFASMHLQNRVTPFGDIVAIPQRGMFTGNRGIIHDPVTKTLLNRRWVSKAWIVCSLEYKGRCREVMAGRSWTELFFLDEAVALAAGHRPCFVCRREAAEQFRKVWALGRAMEMPRAAEMDAVLHAERLDHGRKRLHALPGPADELPDG